MTGTLSSYQQGFIRIPGTLRTSVAAETLRDWLHAYRCGGFDALLPKPTACSTSR